MERSTIFNGKTGKLTIAMLVYQRVIKKHVHFNDVITLNHVGVSLLTWFNVIQRDLSWFNMVTMPRSNGGIKQTTTAIGMQ